MSNETNHLVGGHKVPVPEMQTTKENSMPKKTQKVEALSYTEDGEYGPLIVLLNRPDDRFPFKFGPGKAHKIVQHIEAIKKFAAAHPEDKK